MLMLSKPGARPAEVGIVFDSPAQSRLEGRFGVRAGVFALAAADLG
jgi:hypothetical protein